MYNRAGFPSCGKQTACAVIPERAARHICMISA
jgi:hypothetical protein